MAVACIAVLRVQFVMDSVGVNNMCLAGPQCGGSGSASEQAHKM